MGDAGAGRDSGGIERGQQSRTSACWRTLVRKPLSCCAARVAADVAQDLGAQFGDAFAGQGGSAEGGELPVV